MRFAFTEEQQALRTIARRFLQQQSSPERVRAAMERPEELVPPLWSRIAAELGWAALLVPEESCGLGLGAVEMVAIIEEAGRTLLCAPLLGSACCATTAIRVAGDAAEQARLLPALATGERISALAVVEPGGSWTQHAFETTAAVAEHGFVLRGVKRHVLDGARADHFVVVAREPGGGCGFYELSREQRGVSVRSLPTMDSTRGLAELVLDGVLVPPSARLAGHGFDLVDRILERSAVFLAAEQVGGAQACLDMAVDYAKVRHQFGRPIGSFQAIKHKCADMLVWVESARSAAYYAACLLDEAGDDPARAAEVSEAAATAKAYCSEAYFRCAAESVQIHGGIGITWEHDAHLHLKRARAGEGLFGTPDHYRDRVADQLGL
jgi:alkylation response protein AidB-like acyl-CoA dehydrogenase